MRKIMLAAALLVLIGGGIAVAATTNADEVVRNPARADCPGVIECPLTGDPVCADECPLNEGAGELPPCCRNAK